MAKVFAAMRAILSAIAACFPIGAPHWTRWAAQRRVISRQRLPSPAQAESFAFGQEDILARHMDIGEANDAVIESSQSHETAAVSDFDSGPIHLDEESGNLVFGFARDHFGWRPGHDDDDSGFGAVGAPELFAIEQEGIACGSWLSARAHGRRIGTDACLGKCEGGDLAARDTG
jgi:hypothetical protein